MQIDGSTKLVGVFGSPIAHTASPAMHNAAFEVLEMNWVYLAFHVAPDRLREALLGARDLGLVGVNLTVPHKVLALDLADVVDPEARKLGAVNTIHFRDNKLYGFNTDGPGFVKALREEFNLSLKGKRVLVLGAGGAGRAIAVKSSLEGATSVVVANRTLSKIEPIARELAGTKTRFTGLPLTTAALARIVSEVDLIVNTTSVGLRDGDSLGLDPQLFSPQMFVFETIYRPPETELVRQARGAGAKVANGLTMLLHQGARSFEIWTRCKAPLTVMRRALRATVYGEKS